MPPIQTVLNAYNSDQITVTASATRLTLATVRNSGRWAEKVLITVATATIRWLDNGTDPTSTLGHLAYPGDVISLDNRDRIDKFRAIRTGGTSAVLDVSYLA